MKMRLFRSRLSVRSLTALALVSAPLAGVLASDWPQWRGPNRDGRVPDVKAPLNALPKELKSNWRMTIGSGHAAPIIADGKLIYLDLEGGKEVAHVADASTGKEVWKSSYGPAVEYSNFDPGPRCAPLVDGDRLYVQSGGGEFRCLSLKDGKVIWGTSFEKDFGAKWFGNTSNDPDAKETASRRHGNNGSPVIDGETIFVPVGAPNGATLVAFDKKTGKKLWQAGEDNTAYSSLMVGTLAGVKQVVHFTADAVMGVDAANGKVYWRIPVKTGAKRNTVTPILVGNSVIISSHTVGMLKFDIVKSANGVEAKPAWANKNVQTMLSTPVIVGDYLYALGALHGKNTDFVCVDLKTGKEQWVQPGMFADYASLIAVGDSILALNSTGEMLLIRANPQRYEELGRTQVCGKTWSFPAYANGKLYVRDGRQLISLELGN